jgi:DNA adenine methylase
MNRFMRYQGSKMHFIKKFNEITHNLKKDRYVEPFIGSGAILFNLNKGYDEYVINDLNEYVISIYQYFKNSTYEDLQNISKEIQDKFGDIKESKDSYYKFREWYNENYHFSKKIERGGYLYFLANSCINSMLRFGPNGMNQSFGNRLYMLDNVSFNYVKNTLNKSIILNKDYRDINYDDSLVFFDPPYFERPTSYSNNFDENSLEEFLDFILKIENSNILYTDIFSDNIKEYLSWDFIKTKIIKNSSPGKAKDKFQEACFYNFKYNNYIINEDEW